MIRLILNASATPAPKFPEPDQISVAQLVPLVAAAVINVAEGGMAALGTQTIPGQINAVRPTTLFVLVLPQLVPPSPTVWEIL